jgi:hypothetical protein
MERPDEEIANLAFIGGKTNRAISDKEPSKYLAKFLDEHGPDLLNAQAIPTDVRLLDKTVYKQFLVNAGNGSLLA